MDSQNFLDSLVFDYLQRFEMNASVLFSMNRNPVRFSYIFWRNRTVFSKISFVCWHRQNWNQLSQNWKIYLNSIWIIRTQTQAHCWIIIPWFLFGQMILRRLVQVPVIHWKYFHQLKPKQIQMLILPKMKKKEGGRRQKMRENVCLRPSVWKIIKWNSILQILEFTK